MNSIRGQYSQWGPATADQTRALSRKRREQQVVPPGQISAPFGLRLLAYVFVLSTVFDRFTFAFTRENDNASRVLGMVLLGMTALHWLSASRKRSSTTSVEGAKATKVFVAFFAAVVIEGFVFTAFPAPFPRGTVFGHFFSYVQVGVMFLIFAYLFRDPRVAKSTVILFVATYVIASVLSNLNVPLVTYEHTNQQTGLVGLNLNAVAFREALSFVGILGLLLTRRFSLTVSNTILTGCGLTLLVAVARTGSRSGLVTLVFGTLLALLIHSKLRSAFVYATIVPLLLIGIYQTIASTEIMAERFEAAVEGENLGSRDKLTLAGLRLLKERPLTGYGAQYVFYVGREIGKYKAVGAHNTFLQVWLAFGIVGFGSFLSGLISVLRSLWRQRVFFWGRAVLVALTMTLVNGMALHLAYDKVFWLTMALACSCTYLAWREVGGRRSGTWRYRSGFPNRVAFQAGAAAHRTVDA